MPKQANGKLGPSELAVQADEFQQIDPNMRRNEIRHFRRRQLLLPMALADRLRVGAQFLGIVNWALHNCRRGVNSVP